MTSEPLEIERLFHDRDLLVVVKPAGLATTAPRSTHGQKADGCLVDELRKTVVTHGMLHPSSRLDREVSGLVTFALSSRANQALLQARRRGEYLRRYLAIVTAPPEPPFGSWHGSIAISQRDKRKREVSDSKFAKPAATRFQTLSVVDSGAALLLMFPETGRTHQLRVHASHSGSPILGDIHYGGPRRTTLPDGTVVFHPRVMLHCAAVSFPKFLPGSKAQNWHFRQAPPQDFASQWSALGGEAECLEQALDQAPLE